LLLLRVVVLQAAVPHTPIVLGRAALRRLRPGEVLVRRWPNPCLPAQWFRLLDEEQPVVVGPCGHFFEAEEYEMVRQRCMNWHHATALRKTPLHCQDIRCLCYPR
jgi:hypothetical protein